MITVKLLGGLGNQMFQLAFATALQHRGYRVQLNKDSLVEGTHREYSLGVFGDFLFGDPTGTVIAEKSMPFNEAYLKPEDPSTMFGYWQTEKYFKGIEHKLSRGFSFRRPPSERVSDLISLVRTTNSAFVHVRRGDYVGLQSFHGMPTMDYYNAAIARTGASNILIFSDDPEWCKKNFGYHVIEGTSKYEDMQIMSACRHAVIANSSFSWWAAWFQCSGGTVVAPKQWFADKNVDSRDIIPERWVKL